IPAPIVLEPIATATLAEVIATTTPKENDQDGDGILDEADQCPDNVGVPSFNGCSFGIQTSNKLHTIDMAKTGACPKNNPLDLLKNINTCETNLSNVVLKAFDTEDLAFAETYGTNPERGSFSDIFKNTVGYVNKCTSDNAGDCTIGVDHPGKFLIVGAYYDNINNLIVYHGRFVSLDENTNTAQTKILRFIKVIDENKNIYYRAGKRIIIKGSQLNIDTPEYTPKSSESELYPFIFSSDEEWSINLCLDLPPGYGLQNVIDQSGKGLNPANCPTLTAKSNANGLILFKVNNKNKNLDDISFAIKTSHKNKITGEMVYNEVNGSLKNIDIEKNSVVEKYWIREIMRQEIESQQAEQRLIWLEFLTIITMIIAIFSLLMALAAWHSEKKERDNICKLFLACFYLLHLPRAKRKIIKIKVRKIFQKRK
ncbi:MAG: hypothetical protein NT091_04540, partial [Candidatus Falkowbacteria bacterium]|nr:hypothetical protein [Candidatus Falkowbacteria bacterium]